MGAVKNKRWPTVEAAKRRMKSYHYMKGITSSVTAGVGGKNWRVNYLKYETVYCTWWSKAITDKRTARKPRYVRSGGVQGL
jgi:hypothetical protein